MSIAEILRAGKARLIKNGWCQGDEEAFRLGGLKCCAATAISDSVHDWKIGIAACRFLEDANGLVRGAIAAWNDAPERTLEEVLAAYDKAITAADLKITHAELAAMPMQQAVVAFLRAIRTFDEVGDIDGPWRQQADPFLCQALGVPDIATYLAWERAVVDGAVNDDVKRETIFAVHDKAIAAAERAAS